MSEIQKEVDNLTTKPYNLGGFLEFQPITFGDRPRSRLSHGSVFIATCRRTFFEQYNLRLRLEGELQKGYLLVFFQTDTSRAQQVAGWKEEQLNFSQGYSRSNPTPTSS